MYALTGYPLGHSFSQRYFTERFRNESIEAEYCLFPAPSIEDVKRILNDNSSLQGLNITIPYKEDIISLLSDLNEDAKRIGAVNCVKFIRGTKEEKPYTIGYNTDWRGFSLSLSPYISALGDRALVLGSGGASKAVCYALEKLQITPTVVSRNPKNGQLGYDELTKEIIESNCLIVNTTPLGMYPDIEKYPPIPYQFITKNHLCYDLIYNPDITRFMNLAQQQGAKVKNGLEMLYRQADLSWEIWND